MDKDVFVIGMDLGASKTAVVASNGRREMLPSIVGRPKDRVARSMLGKDVLFGQEVFDNRLALHVVRPFEKGMLKYSDPLESGVSAERIEEHKKAAQLLVDRAVSLVQRPAGASVRGVIGVPSRASQANQQLHLEAAESVFDSVIVVPEPFAVAYGMDRLQNTLVVDIGAGTIDICAMCGTLPLEEDQVTIPIGGDAIDEDFCRRLGELYPDAQLSIHKARDIKERYGFVHGDHERAVVCLPTGTTRREFDVTEPLKSACQIILEPLAEGLKRVISRVDPEFRARIMKNILLSGGGSQLRGLDRAVESLLGVAVEPVVGRAYDCMFAGAVGAFKLAMAMTDEQWEVVYQKAERSEAGPTRKLVTV